MKKIFGLAAAFALLSGCDDGEMTFKTFDFTDADVASCSTDSDIRFKINDNRTEVLILDIDIATVLVNTETPEDEPREINVSGTNLIYRNYNGNVSNTTLCSAIPPVSPSVLEEWLGDGVLQIVTRKVYDPDDITHLTGYSHQITLKSVTFTKVGSNEQVIITDNNYGVILRNLGFEFDFETTSTPPAILNPCNGDPLGPFYRLSGKEALVLTLEESVINSHDTTTPVVIDIEDNDDENDLVFRVFSSNVGQTSICAFNPPVSPVETERWVANEGQIKIVTTQNGSTYTHTVHLIAPPDATGVTFKKGTEIYEVEGADYVIGTFTN